LITAGWVRTPDGSVVLEAKPQDSLLPVSLPDQHLKSLF